METDAGSFSGELKCEEPRLTMLGKTGWCCGAGMVGTALLNRRDTSVAACKTRRILLVGMLYYKAKQFLIQDSHCVCSEAVGECETAADVASKGLT